MNGESKKTVSTLKMNCDGASRGNPGPAAIGAVLYETSQTEPLLQISRFIGMATNNEAEYQALIAGIEACREFEFESFEIRMDSELIVKQLLGQYRVKNERLKPLFQTVVNLLRDIPSWKVQHVPREQNKEADRLANEAYKSL